MVRLILIFSKNECNLSTSHVEPHVDRTIIEIASVMCDTEIVKLFVHDNRFNHNDIITSASIKGRTETVKYLLSLHQQINVANHDNGAIRLASKNGHTEIVELLLKDGRADPSAGNNFAIQFATKNGHTEIVRLLLDDNRVNMFCIIQIASRYGHLDIIKLILKHFSSEQKIIPEMDILCSIRFASEYKHSAICRILKKYKKKYYDNMISHESYINNLESENKMFEVLKMLFMRNGFN